MSAAVKPAPDHLEGNWYWDCPDCICYRAWFQTKKEAAQAYRRHRENYHGERVEQGGLL